MPQGTLQVLLISAKGLHNTDFIKGMDPYVVLICGSQEQRSSVASGQGSEPKWNENFIFTITEDVTELILKIMDKDPIAHDFVGEATVPLKPLFLGGNLPPTAYRVVKEEKYKGEIKVALNFTPAQGCRCR